MIVKEDYSLEISKPRLNFSELAFRWRAGSQWNSLPQDLRSEVSIGRFKKRIKLIVLQARTWDPGE